MGNNNNNNKIKTIKEIQTSSVSRKGHNHYETTKVRLRNGGKLRNQISNQNGFSL